MEIHKPKPWHGTRELAKEIGVIVIGVLIALGGEQTVEWLHRRVEVGEARKALRSEIELNASTARFNVAEERCRSGFLDRVAAWANGGSRPQTRSSAGLDSGSTSVWDVVKAGAVAHMPLEERLAYSQFYYKVDAIRWLIENERTTLFRIGGRVANDALTPAAAQLVREDITQARGMGLIHAGASASILQAAKAIGVNPPAMADWERAGLAGICADGGMAPSTP